MFSGIYYNLPVQHDDDIIKILKNSSETCIIAPFGHGHMYDYFSEKNVYIKSHAKPEYLKELWYSNLSCLRIWHETEDYYMEKFINVSINESSIIGKWRIKP